MKICDNLEILKKLCKNHTLDNKILKKNKNKISKIGYIIYTSNKGVIFKYY